VLKEFRANSQQLNTKLHTTYIVFPFAEHRSIYETILMISEKDMDELMLHCLRPYLKDKSDGLDFMTVEQVLQKNSGS
jgi:hypothetical protein